MSDFEKLLKMVRRMTCNTILAFELVSEDRIRIIFEDGSSIYFVKHPDCAMEISYHPAEIVMVNNE